MSLVIDDVLVRLDPSGGQVPVVFDSPHSGTRYPAHFNFTCPLALLRQTEDTYVDELFADVTDHGATLLCALFPRSFVDVNRAPDDIDPDLLDGPWPGPLSPTEKSAMGMGLVRSLCRPGLPMYDGKLSVADVMDRIERYWRPYHEQLAQRLDTLHARFGTVWHINCHSMPSLSVTTADGRGGGADFVLGDRDGTSCDPGLTRFVADFLGAMDYRVRINDPYKGVELVRRYAQPSRGRHSLQIEVDRRLYMDEETLEKHPGFDRLSRDLGRLAAALCERVGAMVACRAAE